MLGSPQWCALPAGDARKLASLFDAARHHALRVETAQQALCDASRAVAAEADWRAIGKEMLQLADAEATGYRIARVTSHE
jgi:hypothetical protein